MSIGHAFFGDCDGLPAGGTTDQYLAKVSDNDYDVEWRTFLGEGMQLGSSGTLLANTIGTVVPFDNVDVEHPSPSIFTFDDANDTIEVGEDGLYCVSYHIWFESGTFPPMLVTAVDRVRASIEKDTGSGFGGAVELMLNIKDWVLVQDEQRDVFDATQLIEMTAGDKIRLVFGRAAGSVDVTMLLNQAMLAIHKVK